VDELGDWCEAAARDCGVEYVASLAAGVVIHAIARSIRVAL